MKLYGIYNKIRNSITYFYGEKESLTNDEQWVQEEFPEIIPILVKYVDEQALANVLLKIGKDCNAFLSYDNGFVFDEENFKNTVLTNPKAIGSLVKYYESYLSETDWYVVRSFERGVPLPTEIAEKRLKAVNYVDTH